MNIDRKRVEALYNTEKFSVKDAIKLQRELARKVVLKNAFTTIRTVSGVDLAIDKKEKKMVCGIIVYSYPDLVEVERVYDISDETFPYIPGLLAFREGPSILKAYDKLKIKPDILILDGHGTAHPRQFGIACHIGVLLDIPSFGIGKKRLYGEYKNIGKKKGDFDYLKDNERIIGAVLRTKDNVKPVFVSVGNKIDINSVIEITINCDSNYRIPFPTREADKYVAALKKELLR